MDRLQYIAFEGIDGSGTTTLSELVYQRMNEIGMKAGWTHEPSDLAVGSLIRRILSKEVSVSDPAMIHLFLADRIDLVDYIVKPLLEDGMWVVSDRCFLSTLCYQSITRSVDSILAFHKDVIIPGLIFVLDVDLNVAKSRRSSRKSEELYENQHVQEHVSDMYYKATSSFLRGFGIETEVIHVDGNLSKEEVLEDVLDHIVEVFS